LSRADNRNEEGGQTCKQEKCAKNYKHPRHGNLVLLKYVPIFSESVYEAFRSPSRIRGVWHKATRATKSRKRPVRSSSRKPVDGRRDRFGFCAPPCTRGPPAHMTRPIYRLVKAPQLEHRQSRIP
jgi:hypothetical protein